MESNKPTTITNANANSNVLVRGKAGVLSRLLVPKADAHIVAIYDGTDTTTLTNNTLITTLPASFAQGAYELQMVFTKGIVLAISASYAGEMVFLHRAG